MDGIDSIATCNAPFTKLSTTEGTDALEIDFEMFLRNTYIAIALLAIVIVILATVIVVPWVRSSSRGKYKAAPSSHPEGGMGLLEPKRYHYQTPYDA